MDTNKNSYTIIYAIIMVVVVALLLALVSGMLKGRQTQNIELDKKKQILNSLNLTAGKDVESVYDEYVTGALVVNYKGEVIADDRDKAFAINIAEEFNKPPEKRDLPVFIATIDGQTKYILSVRGTGLWGPLWGYVALNDDKNTIYGTYFSHASETPGLGAEIAHKEFQHEFIGKKIMDNNNQFVSIAVVKPGQKNNTKDYVDGISGGTITSKGLEAMLFNSISQYEPFLHKPETGGK